MAVGALVGLGTSLIGGILGSNSASTAGNILANAGTTAATNINNTAAGANAGLGSAGAGAQQGVSAATTGAQQGMTAATTGAQGAVSAATSGAQSGMANALGAVSPYQAAGSSAVQNLSAALGPNGQYTNALNTNFSFDPSDLQNTPGYQFQLNQGLTAEKNQMAAAGLGNSGAAMKGAANYATGLAGTYYQNAYNNALNTYQTNRQNTLYGIQSLMGMAGIGQQANQQALAGQEYIGNTGMQGAQYIGNAGMQGAQYSGNVGMQGSQYIGNVGMQTALQQGNWSMGGQEAAMQAYMQGQAGLAAGKMGSGNAWQNAIAGMGSGLTSLGGMFSGGGYGGGGYGGYGGANMSMGSGLGSYNDTVNSANQYNTDQSLADYAI